MDLGLKGRGAIVCASSRGLGKACVTELARAGCRVVVNGRDRAILDGTAAELRTETGADIIPILGDVADAGCQKEMVAALPQVDILINNNGGPPFRDFREVDRGALLTGLTNNMICAIELVQRVIDGMAGRRFGRIVNITSGSVKMPLAGLDVSSGARAGLTGFLAGVARSVAHANVTINFLLPGSFDTQRLKSGLDRQAKSRGVDVATVRKEEAAEIPAGRFGEPSEFGAACAFLCSAQAGYITGQNILIDGGAYPGVM